MNLRRPSLALAAAAILGATAASALIAAPAQAAVIDVFTSTLTVGPAGLPPGPYGTVTIDLTGSTTATAIFTAAPNFYFIDSSIADLQVNAGTFTVGNFTATPAPGSIGTAANLSFGGAGNVNGFGVFNLTTNNMDGTAQALTTVDFDITNTSGTWASAANVLTTNASGFDAAAHVVNCPGGITVQTCSTLNGGNPLTFFVAETGGTSVPEPTSLALFGTGLIGLGMIGWFVNRRRRFES